MIVRVNIPSAEKLTKKLGIDKTGQAQLFHTMNIYRHMLPYMPM